MPDGPGATPNDRRNRAGPGGERSLAPLLARLDSLGISLHLAPAPVPASAAYGSRPPGRAASSELALQELRRLLSRRTGGRVQPDAWALDWNRSGRPVVRGPERGFRASIAHTFSLFAVAVATRRRLGVDLEVDRPVPEADIPRHLLSPAEAALVREHPARFLTIWTLKEALGKERGDGLLADCRAIDAAPYARADAAALLPRPDGGAACHARFRSGDERYLLALTFGPLEP